MIDELRKRNVRVFRFNTDAGSVPSFTSFTCERKEVEFSCDGKNITSSDIAISWHQQTAPYLGQAGSERKRDIHVVVVGDSVFAASCIPGSHQCEDVRKETDAGESYRVCSFDTNALQKLRALMQALNLDYCAADFMEDKDGNLFFLEVNTCGA